MEGWDHNYYHHSLDRKHELGELDAKKLKAQAVKTAREEREIYRKNMKATTKTNSNKECDKTKYVNKILKYLKTEG